MGIFRGFGAVGAITREGICGAVSVEDDTEGSGVGVVAELFWIGNADYAWRR